MAFLSLHFPLHFSGDNYRGGRALPNEILQLGGDQQADELLATGPLGAKVWFPPMSLNVFVAVRQAV